MYGFSRSTAQPATNPFGVVLSWTTSAAVGRGNGWSAPELAAIEELSGTLALSKSFAQAAQGVRGLCCGWAGARRGACAKHRKCSPFTLDGADRSLLRREISTSSSPNLRSGGVKGLQPAAYARAVATVDIAELALEIGFLAGHYAVAD